MTKGLPAKALQVDREKSVNPKAEIQTKQRRHNWTFQDQKRTPHNGKDNTFFQRYQGK